MFGASERLRGPQQQRRARGKARPPPSPVRPRAGRRERTRRVARLGIGRLDEVAMLRYVLATALPALCVATVSGARATFVAHALPLRGPVREREARAGGERAF